NLYPELQAGGKEKEKDSVWHGLLKPQSPPPVTHLLQQGHIYSNKTTPPNSFQVVLLPDDQAFKYMSLWGAFSFKPQQS
ncbi:hypothetical protein ACQP3C_25430, partial [Escherichia coli]